MSLEKQIKKRLEREQLSDEEISILSTLMIEWFIGNASTHRELDWTEVEELFPFYESYFDYFNQIAELRENLNRPDQQVVLDILFQNLEKVVTYDDLVQALKAHVPEAARHENLRNIVLRIRNKANELFGKGIGSRLIENSQGYGYVLRSVLFADHKEPESIVNLTINIEGVDYKFVRTFNSIRAPLSPVSKVILDTLFQNFKQFQNFEQFVPIETILTAMNKFKPGSGTQSNLAKRINEIRDAMNSQELLEIANRRSVGYRLKPMGLDDYYERLLSLKDPTFEQMIEIIRFKLKPAPKRVFEALFRNINDVTPHEEIQRAIKPDDPDSITPNNISVNVLKINFILKQLPNVSGFSVINVPSEGYMLEFEHTN